MKPKGNLWPETKSPKETATMVEDFCVAAIEDGLEQRGAATLALSGGSTPTDTYRFLATKSVDWSNVTIGPVDEWFVRTTHLASNQSMIERTPTSDPASQPRFVLMVSDRLRVHDAADATGHMYRYLPPFDFALFGTGTHRYAASWFPNNEILNRVKSENAPTVIGLNAPKTQSAAERPTLTKPAIASVRQEILLTFGEKKKTVFMNTGVHTVSDRLFRISTETLVPNLPTIWVH